MGQATDQEIKEALERQGRYALNWDDLDKVTLTFTKECMRCNLVKDVYRFGALRGACYHPAAQLGCKSILYCLCVEITVYLEEFTHRPCRVSVNMNGTY